MQPRHHPATPRISADISETTHRIGNTHYSQVVNRPCLVDILQCAFQTLHLRIHALLRVLGALHRLGFKCINGFQLPIEILFDWLESFEVTLNLINDRCILQLGTVIGEIDVLWLRGEKIEFASRIVIALFEGKEGGGGLAFETEGGGDFGPVEFGGGGALFTKEEGQLCSGPL